MDTLSRARAVIRSLPTIPKAASASGCVRAIAAATVDALDAAVNVVRTPQLPATRYLWRRRPPARSSDALDPALGRV